MKTLTLNKGTYGYEPGDEFETQLDYNESQIRSAKIQGMSVASFNSGLMALKLSIEKGKKLVK